MLVTAYKEDNYIIYSGGTGDGVNARFIDGRTRNRKYCAGYCNSTIHPGYLTDDMVLCHQCGDKNCDFFCHDIDFEKEAKKSRIKEKKRRERKERAEREEVMRLCCNVACTFDGVGIAKVRKEGPTLWEVRYAAIASFDKEGFEGELKRTLNADVHLVDCGYDFERAVELVFG